MLIKHNDFLINHEHCDFIRLSGAVLLCNFTYGTHGLLYDEAEQAKMAFEKIEDYFLGGKDFCDISPSVISARVWGKKENKKAGTKEG